MFDGYSIGNKSLTVLCPTQCSVCYSQKVDPKKLEKAEAKLKEKAEKRTEKKDTSAPIVLNMATASQVMIKMN